MSDQTLGYCGLFCGGCGVYQSTQNGEQFELEPGVFMTCDGCNSNNTTPWCTNCDIKTCCRNRGIRYCLECPDFSCDKTDRFMNDEKYPYHSEVPQNMQILKEIGFEEWEKAMQQKYICKTCGKAFNWFDKACPTCK